MSGGQGVVSCWPRVQCWSNWPTGGVQRLFTTFLNWGRRRRCEGDRRWWLGPDVQSRELHNTVSLAANQRVAEVFDRGPIICQSLSRLHLGSWLYFWPRLYFYFFFIFIFSRSAGLPDEHGDTVINSIQQVQLPTWQSILITWAHIKWTPCRKSTGTKLCWPNIKAHPFRSGAFRTIYFQSLANS